MAGRALADPNRVALPHADLKGIWSPEGLRQIHDASGFDQAETTRLSSQPVGCGRRPGPVAVLCEGFPKLPLRR